MTDCPCEEASQHPQSPGTVADHEVVCRAAYNPMHFNRSGIRTNFVKRKDLANGELSIWRLERDPTFTIDALAQVLRGVGPPNNVLGAIMASVVSQIRYATMPDLLPGGQRVFCVSDDCRTGEDDNWHPEHAAVALADIPDFDWNDDRLETAVQGLAAILKQQQLWPTPKGE